MSFIRNPKDFWSGAIFIAFGLAGFLIGRDYHMGTALHMGAAYFPSVLSGLLIVIGAIAVVRSMIRPGDPIGRFAFRELSLVIGATLLFGFLVRGTGVAIAIIVLVMVSGFASIKFKVIPFLAVAIGMAAFTALVFIKALGLQMSLFGTWLGF